MSNSNCEAVKVMVRCRPLSEHEKELKSTVCVQIDSNISQVKLLSSNETTQNQKIFSFDKVFDNQAAQSNIYEESVFPIVESIAEGYNGTIFAYGQTGSGKTFTMMGIQQEEQLKGVIPRTFNHIMQVIESDTNKNFLLRCSYLEIYNEEIHDLLSKDTQKRYELKESPDKGVFVKDLSMKIVKSIAELEKFLQIGSFNRATKETQMNSQSSRSHSIFSIYLETSQNLDDNNTRITAGKLNLVDLAGSERQSKTQAAGNLLKEATKINLSLSALGNVISALVDGKSTHIPYRDSKLTRLLQDSLGGNTKTVMIACVSPASYNYDETLGTLRYASRAKNIQNKPKVNEDPKDALLKEYADEIQRLKNLLNQQGNINMANFMMEGNIFKKNERFSEEEKSLPNEDKERFEKELKNKKELLENEKKEKEKLETLLKELEEKLFVNQHKLPEKKLKEYESLKKKMKKQKKIEEQLLQEKKNKELEVKEVEKKYQNISEEVEELKRKNKELNDNLKNALCDIGDLQKEQEVEKEDYLQTIRVLEKNNNFLTKIVQTLLTPGEIEKLESRAEWSEETNEYKIIPFKLQNKKIKFPKISKKDNNEMIENHWSQRDLVFTESSENNLGYMQSQNSIILENEKERNNYKKDNKKNHTKNNESYFFYQQSNSQQNIKKNNRSQKSFDYGYEQNSVLLPVRNKNNMQLEPIKKKNLDLTNEITESALESKLNSNEKTKKKSHHNLMPIVANPNSMKINLTIDFNSRESGYKLC